MSELSPSNPFESLAVPTPDELYAFGVRLNQLVVAYQPGGDLENTRVELNEDYTTASADYAAKEADIAAKQEDIKKVEKEIVDIIESMSNDDAMIPAQEHSAPELIRVRTDILYSRLILSKKKKITLLNDIKILERELGTTDNYKDRNRQTEQSLVNSGVVLRAELTRLALSMCTIEEIDEKEYALPRYGKTYQYAPPENSDTLRDFLDLGAAGPDTQYTTITLPIDFPQPHIASEELTPISLEKTIKPPRPKIPVSKAAKKHLAMK